jgi:RimJ/RimL family protein N-acetyltransferase
MNASPSWITRKLGRFSVTGNTKIIVWRSFGGVELSLPEGVTVREIESGDVAGAASMDEPATVAYLTRIHREGHHIWYAYCDGIVVHRSVLLPGPASYHLWKSWATLHVPPIDGLILGCATHPKYGGRGIYSAVLALIANSPHWQGKWGFTEIENVASQRALIKAGFHQHHTLTVHAWHGIGKTERGEVSPPPPDPPQWGGRAG